MLTGMFLMRTNMMLERSGASDAGMADGKHSQLSKKDDGKLHSQPTMCKVKQTEDLARATKLPLINYIKHRIQ